MSSKWLTRVNGTSLLSVRWALAALIVSGALIVLDRATGPYIRVSVAFVLPVALVAFRWGWLGGLGVGLLLGASRVWLVLGSDMPGLVLPEVVNLGLNLLVFTGVAVAADFVARERGRDGRDATLPVCGGCGRVRDGTGRWRRFESVVTAVTTASFAHTVCPECESRFAASGYSVKETARLS
jgi:hypothetical protein